MLLPYLRKADTLNKWVQDVYVRNDSLFKFKNGTETFLDTLGGGGGGSGTVTSVGLSMPSAFSVTPGSITSSGTFNVTMPGLSTQYVRANGTVATTDTGMIPDFYLKVRGLLSGTSPITFNQFTGGIGINNATASGTKGAASFTSSFSDNGAGLIDLADLVSNGSCTGCNLNIDSKGRITSYSDGAGGATNNVNIGAGFRPVNAITQEMRTYFAGFGQRIDSVANANGLTWSADTTRGTGLPTYYYIDSLGSENISNTSLTANGNYTQNWNNKQWYLDSIGGQFLFRMGGVGSTGTRRKEFKINWGGSSFGDNLDGYNILSTVRKADNSADSLTMGLMSSGTGVLSMGTYNVANSSQNTFISYHTTGLINISARDSIWIKGAVPTATADSVLGVVFRSPGVSKVVKIPISAAGGGGATLNNIGSGFRWAATPTGNIKTVYDSNTLIWDSTSNTNGLTAKVDTGIIATQYDLTQISATPGGSNTQVQFNDAGVFGGDDGFTYIKTSNTATMDSLRFINARVNENPYNADSVHYRGTSITEGVGQSSGNRYSTLLSYKLNSIESNAGISGASLVVQGVANIPTLPFFDRLKYRWIILEWGVNDINSATDSTTFDNAYRSYIDTLIIARGWPSQRIVILAPSYLNPTLIPTATLAKQAQFRGATLSISIAKNTKWVDIYSAQLFRNPDNLLVDGIHPNDYGAYVYVNSIYNTIKDSVMSMDQNFTVNGYTELQRLKLRNSDTADYKSVVIGQDSSGNVVRFSKDQIIQNSTTLLSPQGASISLVGSGYFGNVTSPNALDKVQVNGAISAYGIRATGSEPVGEVGSYIGMFYASDIGFIYARELPSNTQKPISINPFAALTMVGTFSASGGSEKLYVAGSSKTEGLQVTGGSLGGITGSGIEMMGDVSGSSYIGARDRDANTSKPLTMQLLGGNVMIGSNVDNAVGRLQVAGKLTVATHDIASNSDSALIWDRSTNEYKVALINGGSSGITTLNTLTASTQTFATGTSGTDFNISSSTSTHTFNIPSASTTNRGLVTATSQTFGGLKTFNDGVYVTNSGATGRLRLTGNMSGSSGPSTSGSGLQLEAFTYTDNAGAGTQSGLQAIHLIGQPTITSSNAITYSGDAVTLRINGAPNASGSMTLSHPWAIYANDVSQFGAVAFQLNEQATSVTLGSTSNNIYTGAGGDTWTLPTLSEHPGKVYFIKNAGSGNLTVQRSGSDNLYDTSSVTSITIAAGASRMIIAGSSFWYVSLN
jgi:lysophospholipase L1-like esterase